MKKILSLFLAAVLFCTSVVFAINISAETVDGLELDLNTSYMIENDLAKEPVTVEAYVWFNKRLPSKTEGGSIFGNLRFISNDACMGVSIDAGGYPSLTVKNDNWLQNSDKNAGTYYVCEFKSKSVFASEWVHLAIVRDVKAGEARCYINGELTGTVAIKDIGAIGLYDYFVGGNREHLNEDYFKNGKMRSLTVYSDVRTEAEIKKDMTKLDKSDLLLHYDFSALTEKNPAVLKDLSANKNDAVFNRVFFEEKEEVTDYAFSFAVVGDTQKLAVNYPENFAKIYEYVYDNIDAKNIEVVIGLGDITDTKDGVDYEWEAALNGHKIIDDYVNNIPIIGNHDNVFRYNKFAKQLNYAQRAVCYNDGDYRNTYVEVNVGGIGYIFLNLDHSLNSDIIDWANNVCKKFPNHNIIVSRHGHMNSTNETLKDTDQLAPQGIKAEQLWDMLLSKHENIVLVLSGHVGSQFVLATQRKGEKGNTVTEMLIDFQDVDKVATDRGYTDGGLGVVNMFYFSADGSKLTVETYATIPGKYLHDVNQFTIELDTATTAKYVKPVKDPTPPREVVKATEIKMTINSKTAYVNGEAKTLDAAPIIKNSRTLLPVRFLAENLGASVEWNDATKTATLKTSDTTIEVTINAKAMKVNGEAVALDSPAIIENSRTYLPLRAIANALGVSNDNITWDDATKTATFVK